MPGAFQRAVDRLRRGGLVVFPTDTLYGLGADARNEAAIRRLVEAKGRSGRQPISIAVSSYEEIEPLADVAPMARSFLRTNLPGPFTVLLPPAAALGRRGLTGPVLADPRSIGIRIPDHPLARALAAHVGPITATSANRHGEPPSRSIAEARRQFGRSVDVYLDGTPRPSGRPSILVDLTDPTRPPVLRPR